MDEQKTEQPVTKSKKNKNWFLRHKVLTVIGVIVILAIIGGASGSSKKNTATNSTATDNATQPASSTKSTTPAQTAKIGEAARDGKFEFTVNKITCGVASVGDQYLSKTPQGQFCILNVTVKNIGTEAQTFDASNQYAYDAQNNKLSADSSASLYANNNDQAFLDTINPGNSVTGNIVFDVPKTVTPVTAELHDSALSGGIKVSLQ